MNQVIIGSFIAAKRREQNLTQAQLAEKLGVSNKTVSKWETGKSMPDYSIIQDLCKELHTSLAELMSGESEEKSFSSYNEEQVLDLLQQVQQKSVKGKAFLITILLMFFVMLWPLGGLWELILQPLIGGGVEQSFLYPLYGGIILLAGIIVGCTAFIIEEIRSGMGSK